MFGSLRFHRQSWGLPQLVWSCHTGHEQFSLTSFHCNLTRKFVEGFSKKVVEKHAISETHSRRCGAVLWRSSAASSGVELHGRFRHRRNPWLCPANPLNSQARTIEEHPSEQVGSTPPHLIGSIWGPPANECNLPSRNDRDFEALQKLPRKKVLRNTFSQPQRF